VDLIGEISLMKDLTRTMDITMQEGAEEEEFSGEEQARQESIADEKARAAAAAAAAATASGGEGSKVPPPPSVAESVGGESAFSSTSTAFEKPSVSPSASGTSTPKRSQGIPLRQAIMDKTEEDAAMSAAGLTEEEKELRKKDKKKGGLSKAQREELAAYEKERARVRKERVDTLAKKLVDRISIWTETDKGPDVTKAFQEKTRLEVENLKMESFGLDILHAIGTTYVQKATALLKSQKFLGIGGFFSRLKDKGTLAKETWNTISSAIDAQMTMEEMAKMEEKGGEDWTDEKKVEYERKVTGKILNAAWRGSKFEIQGVLRDVCDEILNDKKVPMSKRLERAQALIISGDIYQKVCLPLHFPISLSLKFLSLPLPLSLEMKLTDIRHNATQKRKATTWPSNNSSPKQQQRKKRRSHQKTRRQRHLTPITQHRKQQLMRQMCRGGRAVLR
jgi:hypothetical protein